MTVNFFRECNGPYFIVSPTQLPLAIIPITGTKSRVLERLQSYPTHQEERRSINGE